VKIYEDEISKEAINIEVIHHLAFQGIPERAGLRSLYWKVLLNYLPLKHAHWAEELEKRRQIYRQWKKELVVDPHENVDAASKSTVDVTEDDHPLCQRGNSKWNEYFKDNETLHEIEKDVMRTFPHLHFFNPETEGSKKHYQALKDILFIYAKLNPGIKYVQGMNELVAPIYYTFANDPRIDWAESAEADAFFCFTNLMSEIRDNFCKSLDTTHMGIVFNIQKLVDILEAKDPQLAETLAERKLNPQFYAFRWITLLLSQEFELPDVMRLWDSFFADKTRFEYFLYFCAAMIVDQRDRLFAGNFATNLKLLQRYAKHVGTVNIPHLLQLAQEMRDNPKFSLPYWSLPEIDPLERANGSMISKLRTSLGAKTPVQPGKRKIRKAHEDDDDDDYA